MSAKDELIARQKAPLTTPSDIDPEAVEYITGGLNALLADVFTLYLKTKNFHWHMSGPHFRDFHLLLDDHCDQLFAMTDDIAERARKIGARTVHSIGDISQYRRLGDNDEERVAPRSMLSELRADNRRLTVYMRATHTVCDEHGDVATASLLEN